MQLVFLSPHLPIQCKLRTKLRAIPDLLPQVR